MTATERTLPATENHNAVTSLTERGIQAICPCGWKGPDHDRRSDDYAYTNAMKDADQHRRKER